MTYCTSINKFSTNSLLNINFNLTYWYLGCRIGNIRGRKGWKIGSQKFVTRLRRSQIFPRMKSLICIYAMTMVTFLVCWTVRWMLSMTFFLYDCSVPLFVWVIVFVTHSIVIYLCLQQMMALASHGKDPILRCWLIS